MDILTFLLIPLIVAGLLYLRSVVYVINLQRRVRAAEESYVNEKPTPITPLLNFDWKNAKPPIFQNFKPKYNISMGIKTDTPSDLLSIDHDYLDRINKRRDIIEQYPDTTHGVLPEGNAVVLELYDYLFTQYLPIRFPTMFQLSPDGQEFKNLVTQRSFPVKPVDAKSALLNLSEVVEEELFLLIPSSDSYRLVAFVCCFPSAFNPAEKLGLLLKEIHGPVPGYDKIRRSMERFFTKLRVGTPIKRQNWSVQFHPELFDCEVNDRVKSYDTEDEPKIENTYLRSELQTLTRLPKTWGILFNFKTYMYKVTDVKAQGQGTQFAEAIEGIRQGNVPEMWEYKGAPRWAGTVCNYLRS
ncbi:hypothetical protein FDECE_7704 [Fusarium decemcellulare]|nr:hypothetical protein FDECE_7704 [Fusarium decemcellulare]